MDPVTIIFIISFIMIIALAWRADRGHDGRNDDE